jgi:WD40 repeat protein
MQADPEVFATAGSDRSIALYDLRHSTPVRKIVMQTRSNAISWNPMEPLNFVAANEDCNLYSYDMRKLDNAFCVHEVCVHAARNLCAFIRGAGSPFQTLTCLTAHSAGSPFQTLTCLTAHSSLNSKGGTVICACLC